MKATEKKQFIGLRVRVFNHVSDSFNGTIEDVYKRSFLVRPDGKHIPWSNHRDSKIDGCILVPFGDAKTLNPS